MRCNTKSRRMCIDHFVCNRSSVLSVLFSKSYIVTVRLFLTVYYLRIGEYRIMKEGLTRSMPELFIQSNADPKCL